MLGQVRGRRHQHRSAGRQHPADQRGVGLGADANGQVDARLDQVERALAGVQVDLQLRVKLQEIGQRGGQLRVGEGDAAGDAQLPAQGGVVAAGFLFHVVHQRQHLLAAAQAGLARVGERDAAGGALQQARAQPLLQRAHMARDHGARHLQLVGRGAEAAALGHRHKHAHGGQPVHDLLCF
ncbi:hypothetical protein FQZ97_1056670 [compost metagenome]